MHTTVDARMNGESINDGDEQWADARMSIDATAPTAGTSTDRITKSIRQIQSEFGGYVRKVEHVADLQRDHVSTLKQLDDDIQRGTSHSLVTAHSRHSPNTSFYIAHASTTDESPDDLRHKLRLAENSRDLLRDSYERQSEELRDAVAANAALLGDFESLAAREERERVAAARLHAENANLRQRIRNRMNAEHELKLTLMTQVHCARHTVQQLRNDAHTQLMSMQTLLTQSRQQITSHVAQAIDSVLVTPAAALRDGQRLSDSSAQFGKHSDQFDADKDRQLMELEAAHLRIEQRCADYERALRSLAQLANEQAGGGSAVRPESPLRARSASPVRDAERIVRQALVQMPFTLTQQTDEIAQLKAARKLQTDKYDQLLRSHVDTTTELDWHKKSLADAHAERDTLDNDWQTKYGQLQADVASLQTQLRTALERVNDGDTLVADVTTQLEAALASASATQQQLFDAQVAAKTESSKCSSLQAQFDSLQHSYDQLEQRMAFRDSELTTVMAKHQSLLVERNRATEQATVLARTNAELSADVTDVRKRLKIADDRVVELETIVDTLEKSKHDLERKLRNTNSTLTQTLAELKVLKTGVDQEQQSARGYQKRIDTLETQLQESKQTCMRAQTQLDDTRDELRRKVAEHQRAVDDLWSKYTLLEAERNAFENRHERTHNESQLQLDNERRLEEDVARYKMANAKLNRQALLIRKAVHTIAIGGDNDTSTRHTTFADNSHHALSSMSYYDAQSALDDSIAEVSAAAGDVSIDEDTRDCLLECERLRERVRTINMRMSSHTRQQRDTERTLEQRFIDVQKRCGQLELDVLAANEGKRQAESNYNTLRSLQASAEAEMKVSRDQITSLKAKLLHAELQLRAKGERAKQLQDQLAGVNADLARVTSEHAELLSMANEWDVHKAQLEVHLRSAQTQLSTANAEVETLRIDNISLQAQVDSSTAACTAAREQLRDRDVSLGRVRRDALSASVPNSSAGAAVEQITQNAEVERLRAKLARTEATLASTQQQRQNSVDEANSLRQYHAEDMLRVVELQLSVAAKQHNIERLTKEVETAKARLQQTEQQLMSTAPSTTHTTDNVASVDTLRSELYEARLRIKALESDCENMRKQLRRLQLSKDNLTDTVKKMSADRDVQQSTIDKWSVERAHMVGALEKLESENMSLAETLSRVREHLAELQQAHARKLLELTEQHHNEREHGKRLASDITKLHARLNEQDAMGKQNMQLLQAELETARAALRRERDARMKYVTASRRTDIDVSKIHSQMSHSIEGLESEHGRHSGMAALSRNVSPASGGARAQHTHQTTSMREHNITMTSHDGRSTKLPIIELDDERPKHPLMHSTPYKPI